MTTLTKFESFVGKLSTGAIDLHSDTLKVMLTNTAPNASTNTVKTDITDISAGNGYTAGGTAASLTSDGDTGGTYKLVIGNVTFTASGGSIGPFRYAVLYDSTTNDLIGYADYGTSITLTSGNSFQVQFDGTNGVLQVT